jgi:WD40 repeat protein/serine/threonine protein kinase
MGEGEPIMNCDELSRADKVDEVCTRFEAAWKAGNRPRIEDYLAGVEGAVILEALRELIELDVHYRLRLGETCVPEDYHALPEVDPVWLGNLLRPVASSAPAPEQLPVAASPADSNPPAPKLADYQIQGEIGEGGMGIVYKALQRSTNRIVALKVVRPDRLANLQPRHRRTAIERFLIEAQAAARLEHENLVKVFEVGEYQDRPYYSMRYVEGASLGDFLRQGPLDPRRAAAYMEQAAHGVHEAHRHGILHRDLKPQNILVDAQTERALVTDFGLAKLTQEGGERTQTGDVMGTPPYMSPEQAQSPNRVTIASDVYSLGATLYALLTGQSPFSGNEPPAATLRRVMEEDPLPPRRLNPAIPRDLETICLKCLEKDPARRYTSAEELAGRLRLFLENRPIPDRPVSTTERLWRWSRRNPILAMVSALAAALFLVIIVGAPIAIASLNAERDRAVDAERKAITLVKKMEKTNEDLKKADDDAKKANDDVKKANDDEKDRLANLTMQLAKTGFEENNAGLADDLLEQVPERFRLTPWRLLKSYVAGSLFTLRGHTNGASSVAFAPDGQVLASASRGVTVKGNQIPTPGEIKLWDARTGQELHILRGHTGGVTCVAFAPDGQVLASASFDRTIKLWDARTGQELRTLRGHTGGVTCVAFAPDGQMLASASQPGVVVHEPGNSVNMPGKHLPEIKLWDARTGQELHTLRGHAGGGLAGGGVTCVAFAPDGQVLASASQDKTVKLWDARTGQELHTLRGHTGGVTCVAFAVDRQLLASASGDKTVKLWDARTGQELRTLRGHMEGVTSVAFAPDGQVLASASHDATVKLWDARTGQELRTLRGHANWVNSVAFAPDGQVLASASHDKTVKLWDARTGQELRTLRGHTEGVMSVAFAPDDQVLASASFGVMDPGIKLTLGEIRLWDARTGQELHTVRRITGGVACVAFAPDGQVLASASQDTIKLWDARTGQELRTLRGHTGVVSSVAFAPDGEVLASGSWDGTVKLCEARTGAVLRTLRGHTGFVRCVAFSPDGQLLASASQDKTVKLWDARTREELHTLRGHTSWGGWGGVTCVAFAPDGQLLASASQDKTVKLWDARTGQELHTLRGHTLPVTSVAFAVDGQLLASASQDKTVKLWDARTGQELRTLRGHTEGVTSVAFAPDGQVLASASADGTVKLWDTRTWEEGSAQTISERERRFRLCVTRPDLHLHRELAGQAEKDKQPFAVAFRLARYLAGKSYCANEPRESVSVAGWFGTAPDRFSLLAGLSVHLRTPFHEPTFPDGIACTGVLYKESNIAPARLLIGTSRALQGDSSNWLNHAFHGGALYRNGEHAKAIAELTEAVRLHGKPSPLTHNFLALTYLAQGEKDKAKAALAQAAPAKDAPWEDILLDRLFWPEIEAAFVSPGAPPPGGLVAWWRADGNAKDSVGGHHGTLKGGVTFAPGIAGQAFRLDGGTRYVEVPRSELWGFGTRDFSIELWAQFRAVTPSSIGQPSSVFIGCDEGGGPGRGHKWFFAYGGGLLNFHINNPDGKGGFYAKAKFSPDLDQWHHLAVTRTQDTFTIYVDGAPVASEKVAIIIPDPDAPLTIGQAEGLGFFAGLIDEVAIYNRALSPAEVKARWSALAPATKPKQAKAEKVGEVRRFVGHTGSVQAIAYSPDGRFALSGGGWPDGDGTLRM